MTVDIESHATGVAPRILVVDSGRPSASLRSALLRLNLIAGLAMATAMETVEIEDVEHPIGHIGPNLGGAYQHKAMRPRNHQYSPAQRLLQAKEIARKSR